MKPFARTTVIALALALPVASAACGGARAQDPRPTAPFTPELARYFDDAVDYVQDVDGLGGRMAVEWHEQIDTLARRSDLIAVARIETVVQDTGVDGRRNYRLTAAVTDVVKGEAPEGGHVGLAVAEGDGGFNTVAGRETRLQTGRYMAFVRWFRDDRGEVRAHWHLTPFSEALLARVRRDIGWQDSSQGQERIVRQEGSHRR